MSNDYGDGSSVLPSGVNRPDPTNMPAPPTVAAQPGAVPSAPPEFGVDLDELKGLSSGWRTEAGEIEGLQWGWLADVSGAGSDTLAALRSCAEPARESVSSIAARFTVMAELVDAFASQVDTTDSETAAKLNEMETR